MCVTEKCCYFVPLDVGCILIGLGVLIISSSWTVTVAALLVKEIDYQRMAVHTLQRHILKLNLNNGTIDILLIVSIAFGVLWFIASLMLIFGVKENKPNFVLTYFGLGTMLTIVGGLSGLLLLLSNLWESAMVVLIIFGIHIHFLMVVYTAYDQMIKGRKFGVNHHLPLEETPIVEDY